MRVFQISVDMAELTLRMVEAGMQAKRPPDATALEALKTLPDDVEQEYHRAARAAADYFGEQMAAGVGDGGTVQTMEGAGHA